MAFAQRAADGGVADIQRPARILLPRPQEGEVGAGDEIVKVGEASERMTVAEVNALLYSPPHPRNQLERALRIEALSPGWHRAFTDLLRSQSSGTGGGNAGLNAAAAAHAAAPGFRSLEVTAIDRESSDVLSLTMQAADDQSLPAALPGQYVVLRLPVAGAPLFRSYSLSGPASTERYRISVKLEPNGVAGTYLQQHVRLGDVFDVSAPRGSFLLQQGERPVVLLSAGIGATPVLAMLHALAAARSPRKVLWLHAARDGQHHPFASEVRGLMPALADFESYVCYSRPDARDRPGKDFDAIGHLSPSVFDAVGLSREADVYLCGPAIHGRYESRARRDWRGAEADSYRNFQRQRDADPWRRRRVTRPPIRLRTTPTPVRWCPSRAAASPRIGSRPTRASWSWPRHATFRFAGRAGPVSVTTARVVSCRARSPMNRSRSTGPPTATFSSAVPSRRATSSSICKIRQRIAGRARSLPSQPVRAENPPKSVLRL